jgi:hypothetical protein
MNGRRRADEGWPGIPGGNSKSKLIGSQPLIPSRKTWKTWKQQRGNRATITTRTPLPFLTVPRSQQGPLFPSLFNLSLIGNADPFWPGSADSTDAFNNFDCDSRDLTK